MTNDDFLFSLRETPSDEFTRSLYQHLIDGEAHQRRKQRIRLIISSTITAMILLFGAVSIPAVRAAIIDTLETIAGVQFISTAEYPGDDHPSTIPYTTMSLEQARNEFNFSLPEWVPEGYIVNDTVQVAEIDGVDQHVIVTWNKPGQPSIQLEVLLQESKIIVGPESVDSIEIGQRSVAVWYGGWNYDEEEWDETINAVTLSWSDDGKTAFFLSGVNDESFINNLMKMIESIPQSP
jgi:hypothetical protein